MTDGNDHEAAVARLMAMEGGPATREEAEAMLEDGRRRGTCSFCGHGDGWLGEQGDETTRHFRGFVRTGEPGDWSYAPHPNAYGPRGQEMVTWCGECVGGLAFEFQRLDDGNLRALFLSSKVRLELDAPRWVFWELDRESDERARLIAAGHWPDDPATHLDKLRLVRDVEDMQNELFRRAGFDLTTRGWRP